MSISRILKVIPSFSLCWYITIVYAFTLALVLLVIASTPQQIETPIRVKYKPFGALPHGEVADNLPTQYIASQDGRSIIIRQFFQNYGSDLGNQANTFIQVADKYKLDYRLLPAIAMQESSGAKKLPEGSYNPFGYGIYGDNSLAFNSFEEAIDRVGRGLKEDYIDQGLKTPYQIMTKYTPPSLEKGGPWAISVEMFMGEMI